MMISRGPARSPPLSGVLSFAPDERDRQQSRHYSCALFPHAGKLPKGRVRSYNASMNRATRAFDRTMQELMSTSDSVEFTIAMEVAGLGEPPESDEPTASVCAPVRLSHT